LNDRGKYISKTRIYKAEISLRVKVCNFSLTEEEPRITLRISNVLRNPSASCYFPTSRTTVENIFRKRAFTRPKFPFVQRRAIVCLRKEEPRVTLRISNVLRNPSTLCYFPTSRTTVENAFQKRAFTRPKFPFVRKRAIACLRKEEPRVTLRISNVLRNPSTLCYFPMPRTTVENIFQKCAFTRPRFPFV
jgi:hypothetical protein